MKNESPKSGAQQTIFERTTLSVYPNMFWSFEDYGKGVLGRKVKIINFQSGQMVLASGEVTTPKFIGIPQIIDQATLQNADLSVLLETRWVHPQPSSVARSEIDGRKVEIIRTDVSGRDVDFYLDEDSHLPVRVDFLIPRSDGTTRIVTHRLGEYKLIDGIMMPSVISFDVEQRRENLQSLQVFLNVAYDPDIFSHPHGPFCADSWKPSSDCSNIRR